MAEGPTVLRRQIRKAVAHLPYVPRALVLVLRAAGRWTSLWAALLVLQGMLPVATVYLTRSLVNHLVAALNLRDWPSVRASLEVMALMGAVLLAGELLRAATGWVRATQAELVQDYITAEIHKKSATLDLSYYDLSEYYDRLELARSEAQRRPVALLEGLGAMLQNGITLAAMGAVLLPFGWWLPVALLLSTLPAFSVVSRFALRQHQWHLSHKRDQRLARYYDWILSHRDPAAELRLFDLGAHFQGAYQGVRRRVRRDLIALARNESGAQLGAGAAGLVISGGAMAWMAWRATQGRATPGDLALLYQAFQQGLRLMRGLLENVGHLYSDILFLGNLFTFLELEPRLHSPADPEPAPVSLHKGIVFRGVTFQYAGAAGPALQQFDLSVPAGQMAAIVGSNGSGKSTLIKLLCRFYDPDDGSIEVDGVNVRRMRLEDLRRLITVLFQEPMRYHATVGENITMSDVGAGLRATEIEAAAIASGAAQTIARLPRGYETELGKIFGAGAELSVGEWQRLALARAYVRRSPILVLDEPTSAMDPWAEVKWLERFRALAVGRTVLVITHRFSTARSADCIHVMAEGRIVESGSHQELVERGGRYAEAWRAQQRGP